MAGGGGNHGWAAMFKFVVWALLAVPWIVATTLSPWTMTTTMVRAGIDPANAPRVIARWLAGAYGWNPIASLWLSPATAPPIPPAARAPRQRAQAVSTVWSLTVRTSHPAYALGQPVSATVTIRNVSHKPQPVPAFSAGPMVMMVDPAGRQTLGPDVNLTDMASWSELHAYCDTPMLQHAQCYAPGDTQSRTVTFTPSAPGAYRIVFRAAGAQAVASVDVTATPPASAGAGPRAAAASAGWRIALAADRAVYGPGDQAMLTVTLTNTTGRASLPMAGSPYGQPPLLLIRRAGDALPVAEFPLELPSAALSVPCPPGTPRPIGITSGYADGCVPAGAMVTRHVLWPWLDMSRAARGIWGTDPTMPGSEGFGAGMPPAPVGRYAISVNLGPVRSIGGAYEAAARPVLVEVVLK